MKKGICYLLTLALMITAIPMQVFGAEIDVVTKVVGVKQYGADFDGKVYGDDVPQLRMKVMEFEYPKAAEDAPSIEITVRLDGAVFLDEKGKDLDDTNIADAIGLLSCYNGEDFIRASYDSENQEGWLGEIKVEAEIRDSDKIEYTLTGVLEKDDQILVDLQSRIEEVSVGRMATVSVNGDVKTGELVYAEIIKQGMVEDDFDDTANIETIAKVVNAQEYPKGFKGKIYLEEDIPEVQLRIKNIDKKSSDQKVMTEFTVLLDNAFFVTEKGTKFKKGKNIGDAVRLVSYVDDDVDDDKCIKASYDAMLNLGWFDTNKNGVYDADEVTVAAEVYGKDEVRFSVIGDLEKNDIISVCLQSEMQGIGLDQIATVSVESDMCHLDNRIFAEIRLQNIEVDLRDEIDLLKDTPVTLGTKNKLTIESTIGEFDAGQEIRLKLNEGFVFIERSENEDGESIVTQKDTLMYQVTEATDEVNISGNDIEIMATEDTDNGDEAVMYVKAVENKDVKGTFDSEQVSVEVGAVQDAKALELDVERCDLSPGESCEVEDLSMVKRDGFNQNDKVTLKLSEGFVFVNDEVTVKAGKKTVLETEVSTGDTFVFLLSEDCGKELEIEGISIAADNDLEDGDRAKLTFSMEGYTSASRMIATVNVEEPEVENDELELDVREIEIEAGGYASFRVLGIDRGNKFKKGDELTLTLNNGFSFVEGNKFYDGDGTEIEWKFLSEKQIVVLAPSNPGQGFDLEELMIAADESLAEGTVAKMTVSMVPEDDDEYVYAPVTEDVAKVVLEAKEVAAGELNLNVEKLQLKAGEEASFENLSIGKTVKFKAGEEITLRLSKGFSFVKSKFYDGDRETVIQVEDWDDDEIVIVAPDDPGFGFDLIGLTIAADEDLPVDEEAIMMVKMRGYDIVKESVAVVVGEPAAGTRSGLMLDVRPISIVAGDESSFEILGIDKDRKITREKFTEGDKVTLKLSEGFSFVENDKFYDGDGTRIWVDSLNEDKNEMVVVAPRDPGMGFDIEELTIVAKEGLEEDNITTARMTASMAGYAPVTEVVAMVVKERTSSYVTMLGDVTCDGKVSAKDLLVLTSHVDENDEIKDLESLANADVTKDGRITIADVKKLARYIGKIIDEL